jgi:hypothetical protein
MSSTRVQSYAALQSQNPTMNAATQNFFKQSVMSVPSSERIRTGLLRNRAIYFSLVAVPWAIHH